MHRGVHWPAANAGMAGRVGRQENQNLSENSNMFNFRIICNKTVTSLFRNLLLGAVHPGPARGADHDRHGTLGTGCDGHCGVGHARMPDENAAADGKVVWSWRRDPGVNPARLCGHGNGDNKGRSPGRARNKP
jgi:hypothetical protein